MLYEGKKEEVHEVLVSALIRDETEVDEK